MQLSDSRALLAFTCQLPSCPSRVPGMSPHSFIHIRPPRHGVEDEGQMRRTAVSMGRILATFPKAKKITCRPTLVIYPPEAPPQLPSPHLFPCPLAPTSSFPTLESASTTLRGAGRRTLCWGSRNRSDKRPKENGAAARECVDEDRRRRAQGCRTTCGGASGATRRTSNRS